jgi:hypothetical protein
MLQQMYDRNYITYKDQPSPKGEISQMANTMEKSITQAPQSTHQDAKT